MQICEDNPRNRCFCGTIFPNNAARDQHAMTCEVNPANRFKCPYCPQEFLNSFGMMGRVAGDGKALRDTHAVVCTDNPANTCFCGNLFPNPEARNAHAVTCDKNPANHYACQFCKTNFIKTFNMFGFCSVDGRAEREAHQLCCDKNPRNTCFCGALFPNPTAREKHAATCPSNPGNRFSCSFCQRLFVTRFGMMGRFAYDGKGQRDAHEVSCEKNPGNVCYCGQLFLSPCARDAHAAKCEMNPANRFNCQYCRKTFVTTFCLFSNDGGAERDAHVASCMKNPANATCQHCNRTFVDVRGPLKWLHAEVHLQCERHGETCAMNPQNRFNCERCGKCFVGGQHWLRMKDARSARDTHHKECDYIPCAYQVSDADVGGWLLMSSEFEGAEMSTGTALPIADKASNADADGDEEGLCKQLADSEEQAGALEASADCPDCQDMGDSASTCFHDAHSSNGDESSESGDVSSTQDVEDVSPEWAADLGSSDVQAAERDGKCVDLETREDPSDISRTDVRDVVGNNLALVDSLAESESTSKAASILECETDSSEDEEDEDVPSPSGGALALRNICAPAETGSAKLESLALTPALSGPGTEGPGTEALPDIADFFIEDGSDM